jgi:hypothetical protein
MGAPPGLGGETGVGFMRQIKAGAIALVLTFAGIQSASSAAVAIGQGASSHAQEVLADLRHFTGRLATFAEGAVSPLFQGRALPLPPETCVQPEKSQRFALLVGADNPGPLQLSVPAAVNDVELLESTLFNVETENDRGDIDVYSEKNPDRESVVEAAWEILNNLRCGDKVIIYFGGYALMQSQIEEVVVDEGPAAPSGRSLEETLSAGRHTLNGASADAAADETLLAIREAVDILEWYRGSGLNLLLRGDGEIGQEPLTLSGFEIMTSADISELVTHMRNHRADVTLVLDTNHASEAGTMQRQREVAPEYWRADIRSASAEGTADVESRFRPTRLVASPGDLAVFYSSVDKDISVSATFDVAGRPMEYGLFTFRLAEAILSGRNPTVQAVRDALDRIVRADDTGRRRQTHRIESTRPDMPVFGRMEKGRQRTDTIRILEPSGMRGASVMESSRIDLVGMVDWPSPAKAVLVEGQPAQLLGDGRFSATVNLRTGVNSISILGLTGDDEIHTMPPLEVVFDGDLKKLKGEGRRYALIIANQNYLPETRMSRLETPIADAEALRDILASRYGFATELAVGTGDAVPLFLVDAGKDEIEDALYTLSQVAGEQDTVLIYYAGHGVYDERTASAYWVPVNAEKPYNYLSGNAITEHVQRMMARSVILISDSCYSGALRSGEAPPVAEVTDEDRRRALLRMADMRARILITSGGNEPVMDTGGGGHSIFARALLTGLERMDADAFSAQELFRDYISPMVGGRVEQVPQFRPIDRTDHEPSADVVFVRLDDAASAGGNR